MTRAVTIIALTCFLVVGAAATSILGRDSVPAARSVMAASESADPVSNKQAKNDKLAVATLALASLEPPQAADLNEPLRQAFASGNSADVEAPKVAAPAATPFRPPVSPKPHFRPPPSHWYQEQHGFRCR